MKLTDLFENTKKIKARNVVSGLYHGAKRPLRNGPYPEDGVLFLSDSREIASMYGSNVYECTVDLGNNADLTSSSSPVFGLLGEFSDQKKNILLGELWKNKRIERKIITILFAVYDSITLMDTSSEEYDDDDEHGFGTTYIVKNASKQVIVAD
jgi:hypothetical protein